MTGSGHTAFGEGRGARWPQAQSPQPGPQRAKGCSEDAHPLGRQSSPGLGKLEAGSSGSSPRGKAIGRVRSQPGAQGLGGGAGAERAGHRRKG